MVGLANFLLWEIGAALGRGLFIDLYNFVCSLWASEFNCLFLANGSIEWWQTVVWLKHLGQTILVVIVPMIMLHVFEVHQYCVNGAKPAAFMAYFVVLLSVLICARIGGITHLGFVQRSCQIMKLLATFKEHLEEMETGLHERQNQFRYNEAVGVTLWIRGLRGSVLHRNPLLSVDSVVSELLVEKIRLKSQSSNKDLIHIDPFSEDHNTMVTHPPSPTDIGITSVQPSPIQATSDLPTIYIPTVIMRVRRRDGSVTRWFNQLLSIVQI